MDFGVEQIPLHLWVGLIRSAESLYDQEVDFAEWEGVLKPLDFICSSGSACFSALKLALQLCPKSPGCWLPHQSLALLAL